MAATQRPGLTETQADLLEALDDTSEHVAWEFDPDNYRGISTIGFAHIANIDGRSSFVQRAKALADSDATPNVTRDERNPVSGRVAPVVIQIGSMELRLAPAYDSGYRLSVSNVNNYISGPEHQRLDVRERLHRLVMARLQLHGYIENARLRSRMD